MQGVRQVLAELTRIGVVRAVGSARLVVYGAADAHPIVAMLDKLFADERQWWLRTRRRLVRAVTHREVLAAWLFGSAARGQDTPMSDLDIAVVLDAPSGAARRIADVLRGRLNKAGEACAFRPSLIAMTLPAFLRAARDESPLWRDLERDAIRLYGPSPSDLMRDNARHAA